MKLVLPQYRRFVSKQQACSVVQRSSFKFSMGRNVLSFNEFSGRSCRSMSTLPQDQKSQHEKERHSKMHSDLAQKQIARKHSLENRSTLHRKQIQRDIPLLESVWGKSPILNVAPLIRISQSSSGRSELLNVLRNDKKHQSYALAGHGVPQQLLQDHIKMAYNFLKAKKTKDVSLYGFDQYQSFDSVWFFDKEINRTERWKPQTEFLQSQMELYLTVMNRLASVLGIVLYEDDDQRKFQTGLSHWNVNISRFHVNGPNCAPLIPMVEWMPQNTVQSPGDLSIRLEGFYTPPYSDLRRKRKIPLTLTFVASFRDGS
mmetsp:Transcript_6940/g.10539  ORF Transcript_6940/g.10539 Transcript_6940/m.10539 type:complete len:315 (-) Transcript_6940:1664-2608(-)